MIRPKALTAATLALLFLAACGSSGIGDILGGGSNPGSSSAELRGTVDYVDTNNRTITLTNVSGYNNSMLSGGSGNGSTVRISYDDRTPVTYNNQTYRPQDLERGDEVAVQVQQSGNTLIAESMIVTRNAASGSSTYPSGGSSYPTNDSVVRGTVRYVDTSRRTIEVDRGNGSLVTVDYETNTPVYFNNQTYRAADLERGDEVDVRVRSTGTNRWLAEQVSVVRSVSNGSGTTGSYPGSTSSQTATVRGTVRTVDASRRTIELESISWRSNFNGNNTNSNRIIVSYDANTMVDVAGVANPVTGLERGDVVDVQVQNANATTPFAQRIYLVQDVRR